MSRTERLLDLLQLLRRHRAPVSGAAMASELGISLRTLYRDVATLQAQGLHIDGAPGLGFQLRAGTLLPPLTFSPEELEALALGTRRVASQGEARLAAAAVNVGAKIAAVMPVGLQHQFESSALLVGPRECAGADDARLAAVREAIRDERKLFMRYRSGAGVEISRTVWPFALGYFERARVLVAWCEHRNAVRHFRSDRIVALESTTSRFPRSRQALLKAWREQEGIVS